MQFDQCPLTGEAVKNFEDLGFKVKYEIDLYDHSFHLELAKEGLEKMDLYPHFTLINGGLLNGYLTLEGKLWTWNGDQVENALDLKSYLEDYLANGPYPRTKSEKYNNLFLKLLEFQKFDGQEINVYKFGQEQSLAKLFFENDKELEFYLQSLKNNGLLDFQIQGSILPTYVQITYEGLNYGVKLLEDGAHSNNCFIAMSYGPEMKEVRETIKAACRATGFTPILVDETHYEADRTINDAMIAQIRKSRFCIADFSEQKDGVYFEAGFALGKGLKVIYTCHKDWWGKSHFDTRHFPHIVYTDLEGLKQGLIDKIEAWIL